MTGRGESGSGGRSGVGLTGVSADELTDELDLLDGASCIEATNRVLCLADPPLPVVVTRAEGAWVSDVDGVRYLDCTGARGTLVFGHRHPRLVAAAARQLDKVTLAGPDVFAEAIGPFARELARLGGKDHVVLAPTGAEAVAAAVRSSVRWAEDARGVHARTAGVVVVAGSPHSARAAGAAATATVVPFGDLAALRAAVGPQTVAVVLEPVDGDRVVCAPPGYLAEIQDVCRAAGVLLVADETRTGLGRTGRTFGCDHDDVVPDIWVLGDGLGGGIVPLGAVLGNAPFLTQVGPVDPGSALAAAVGHEVVRMLADGAFQRRAAGLGEHLRQRLEPLVGQGLSEARVRGLWAGLEIDRGLMTGRRCAERLAAEGVLVTPGPGQAVTLAPPVTISETDLGRACAALRTVLTTG